MFQFFFLLSSISGTYHPKSLPSNFGTGTTISRHYRIPSTDLHTPVEKKKKEEKKTRTLHDANLLVSRRTHRDTKRARPAAMRSGEMRTKVAAITPNCDRDSLLLRLLVIVRILVYGSHVVIHSYLADRDVNQFLAFSLSPHKY